MFQKNWQELIKPQKLRIDAGHDAGTVDRTDAGTADATGGGDNTMRLNFSYSSPDVIREGITRLGVTLKELIAKNGHH